LGVFIIIQFISPGIGFIIGGKLLSIYVDINQVEVLRITYLKDIGNKKNYCFI
jgi:hypothetical protein